MEKFNGVKIFSATLARNREDLGNKVTDWLRRNPQVELVEMKVLQSSDREFHCITIVVFYSEKIE